MSEPRGRRRLGWLERGFYLLALALVSFYGLQWYQHRDALQQAEPTGDVLSELDSSDRIPLAPETARDFNVLVITMDTTRADHIGTYGHRGVRTPVIDSLARSGVLFANAFTTSPSTLPGHSSIFTGLYPHHHGARANGTFHLGSENTTLAEILKADGYATAAFISAYVLDGRFGLDQGFDLYDDDLSKGVKYARHSFRERPAEYANEAALGWIETVAKHKFFAWVHYFDPHAPYMPPEPFRSEYATQLYDGEIAYVDSEIGRLLTGLDELGVRDDTLVVLAADHGEGLGEHGEHTHSLFIYDATLHTPLIISLPRVEGLGKVVHRQVSNVDIVPTILDLLGIETDARFDGVTLLGGPEIHDDSIYAETIATLVLHGWSPLFGIRQQDGKYIHAPKPEFYELAEDPKELKNLLSERPERAAALSRRLREYSGDDLYGSEALAQQVSMDPETAKKLAALGYVGSVNQSAVDPVEAAALDPKDMVPHWERVQEAMNKIAAGKLNEGVEDLEACVEAVPTDVWAMRILASSYFEKGNLDGTEEVVLRALEHEKNEPGLYLLLGQVYMGRGLAQKAKENLRLALDLDPQFAAAYVSLGTLASRTGDPLKAAEYFQRAIEMDPGSTGPTAYNALGMMYLGRMKPDEARESFNEALAIDELNGGAHNGLAMILIEEGKLEEATGELEIAARYMPNSVQVLSTLAALHNKRGEYEQGIELARRALKVNDLFPQALNSLGSALLNTGDLAGAAEAFEKVLAQNAYYVPSMVNLGQVYLAQRREEKAVEMYEQALRVNPYQPLALFNIGTYKTTRGRPDEALAYYRRAIAADPDYAIAHQHLGMLLVMQGQAAEALPHLEKSLKLDADLLERERVAELVEGLRAAADPTMQPNALPAAPGEPQSR